MSRTSDDVLREFADRDHYGEQHLDYLAMADRILALEAEVARACVWRAIDMHPESSWDYEGACGVKWWLASGDLMTNGMLYCPRCGGTITYTPTKADQP